jgi:biofilm PGA synthesis protein PgaD
VAAKEQQILIDSPQLLSRRHRITDAFITGIMWVLYSYLWAPLISLIAWLLGFEFAYDVMVRAGGIETFKEVFWFYLVVVASIFVVIGSWSMINRRRFANRERRKAIEPVSDNEVAAFFGISDEQLRDLRSSRVSQIRLDGEGQIESVEAQILIVEDGSMRPLGPQGGVTENKTGDNDEENDVLIQGSAGRK